MITFKKFITEGEDIESLTFFDNKDEILKLIKKDCAPFLSKVKRPNENMLWRGIKSMRYEDEHGSKMLRRDVRKNREPKDTPRPVHQTIDNYFYEAYGVKFRSESLFCSSSMRVAARYGKPYIIFPIGEFNSLYSPKVHDLTEELVSDSMDSINSNMRTVLMALKKEEIEKWLDQADYRFNTGLDMIKPKSKIDEGVEIMIDCKEYYAIPQRAYVMHLENDEDLENL